MKKIISLVVILTMSVVMLTSCSSNEKISVEADGSGKYVATITFDLAELLEQGTTQEEIIQYFESEDPDYDYEIKDDQLSLTKTAEFDSDDELHSILVGAGYSGVYASEQGRYIRYTSNVGGLFSTIFDGSLLENLTQELQEAITVSTTFILPYTITKTSKNVVVDELDPHKATCTLTVKEAVQPFEVMVSTLQAGEDVKAPKLTGAKEGKTYKNPVTVVANDPSGIQSATFSLNGLTPEEFGLSKEIKLNGEYEIIARDHFGNQSQLNFTFKDKEAPTIEGAEDGKYYKTNRDLNFYDNVELAKVTVNGKASFVEDKEGYAWLTKQGKYNVIATDVNGNVSKVKFVIDKTKPYVKGAVKNKTYAKAVKLTLHDNYGVKSATINGNRLFSGKKVSKNGTYKVVVKDLAGNVTKFSFKIRK